MFAKKVEILHGIDRWNATDQREIDGRDGVLARITDEDGTVTTEEVSVDELQNGMRFQLCGTSEERLKELQQSKNWQAMQGFNLNGCMAGSLPVANRMTRFVEFLRTAKPEDPKANAAPPKDETAPAPAPQPVLPGVDYSAPDKMKDGDVIVGVA